MKKDNKKALIFLSLLILVGISFTLLSEIERKKPPKILQAAIPNVEMDIKETEKKIYIEKMDKFKKIILNLEQNDTQKFKEQTKQAFNEIGSLIRNLPKLPDNFKNSVREITMKMERGAEKVNLLEDEEKVINEIKKSFTSCQNGLVTIKKRVECNKAKYKDFCDKFASQISKIEKNIKEINAKNYKQETKEIFVNFYTLLDYMHTQISEPDFTLSNKPAKSKK